MYVANSVVGQELVADFGIGTDSTQFQGDQDQLAWYLDALGIMFDETASLVIDQGSDGDVAYQTGYGSVFTVSPRFSGDTDYCPVAQLPYLAQYVGVEIPPNANEATARSLIESEQGLHRGTPTAIEAAAMRWLTGTQYVLNVERTRPDGTHSGYWFVLVVKSAEIVSASELVAAVNAVKPGGVMWQLVTTTGQAWVSDSREWVNNGTPWNAN
jgi:hypothetical protein